MTRRDDERPRATRVALASTIVVGAAAATAAGLWLAFGTRASSDVVAPNAAIAAWDDRLVACGIDDDGEFASCAFHVRDSDEWTALVSPCLDHFTADVAVADAQARTTCVPSAPDECYRVAATGLGVERSTDGGATWTPEWGVPMDPALADPTADDLPPDETRTLAVAVVEFDGGFEVGVANGYAGVAVRRLDGTWDLGPLADASRASD